MCVDGSVVLSASHRVQAGQRLEIAPARLPESILPDPNIDVSFLHVDPQIVVVDKPAGIACHPFPGHTSGTLLNALLAHFPELREMAGDAHGNDGMGNLCGCGRHGGWRDI